jgi:hypothetical protein
MRMRTKNITLSIPVDLVEILRTRVEKRELSTFVTKALERALQEEVENLKMAYKYANEDPDRLETLRDWADIELVS